MQVHTFTFLDLSYRSSKLRDESDRLRHDAAELKINVQNWRTKISPPALRSYSNRP